MGNHGNEQVCRNECETNICLTAALVSKSTTLLNHGDTQAFAEPPGPRLLQPYQCGRTQTFVQQNALPGSPSCQPQPPPSPRRALAWIWPHFPHPKPPQNLETDQFSFDSQSVSQACTPCGEPFQGAGAKLNFIQTLHAHWQQKSRNLFKCCFHSSQFWAASSQ